MDTSRSDVALRQAATPTNILNPNLTLMRNHNMLSPLDTQKASVCSPFDGHGTSPVVNAH